MDDSKKTRPHVLTMVGSGIQKHFSEGDIYKMLMKNLECRQKTAPIPLESVYKFKGHCFAFLCFRDALQLKEYPRLYILKEQKPIFIKIIKNLMPLFEDKHGISFE